MKQEQKTEEKVYEKKPIMDMAKIIRILQTDISGDKNLLVGLTKIKGVSWAFSNAVCIILKFDKKRTIESLSKEEIKKIEEFIKNPDVPKFLKNRRKDFDTGEDGHLIGSDLDLKKEFDIKRLKKIRSYRGLRHAMGLPTRGQRTRANFRTAKGKKASGIKKKPREEKK